ncbi:MAG: hypothetical protein ACK58L_19525 [Planctomycetota bacterium]
MNEGSLWAFSTHIANIHRLGELRSMPSVQGALTEDVVWVRGSGLDETLFGTLAAFADGPVFLVDGKNRLTPFGKTVPVDRLPDVTWESLAKLLEPVLPLARIVSVQFPKCPLTLVRSSVDHEASVMIVSWDAFERWAIDAPEIRLRACHFATRGGDVGAQVCVRGNPLPSLPGARFWTTGNIAIPLGLTWSPAVDVDTLREVLAVQHDDSISASGRYESESLWQRAVSDWDNRSTMGGLWIWHEDGRFDVIEPSAFVPALRMHVRATGDVLKSGIAAGRSS